MTTKKWTREDRMQILASVRGKVFRGMELVALAQIIGLEVGKNPDGVTEREFIEAIERWALPKGPDDD